MSKLNYLGAQLEPAAPPGGEINFANWHLSGEAEFIGGGGPVRSYALAPLDGDSFNELRRHWGAYAKPAFDGPNIDAPPSTN